VTDRGQGGRECIPSIANRGGRGCFKIGDTCNQSVKKRPERGDCQVPVFSMPSLCAASNEHLLFTNCKNK
jgi:hypothetical protein